MYKNTIKLCFYQTFILTFLCNFSISYSQVLNSNWQWLHLLPEWQTDVRLTNDPAISFTSNNNARNIGTSGNFVHVVWWDFRQGNPEIYYKRSTDEGTSWGTDTRLTNDTAFSSLPSLSVSGLQLHVVWEDRRDANREIYYKRSTDGGSSWGADLRLTNNFFNSESPCVAVSGSAVHVVWHDDRNVNYEIYYKRSADGGTNWGSELRLTNASGNSIYPSVAVIGQVVHVVWWDSRSGPNKTYYKRSTDSGINWSADIMLSSDSSDSWDPCISVSGQNICVAWVDHRHGNGEIYYKRSTDGGISWGADTRLTNDPAGSEHPSVSVYSQNVHIVWWETRDGNKEIYYKRSSDGGLSWEEDTRLTNNPAVSSGNNLAVAGSNVHVVWYDYRDGNPEIYYKRNPNGNPVGISNNNTGIPKEFSLSQNYPNPFNPITIIRFSVPKQSRVTLKVFDTAGEEVSTPLTDFVLNPGMFEYKFDGNGLASGVYFYSLYVDGNLVNTRKMVLIK
ncbi:MAG: T9SS type A sorting domain-containing protein [Chlorobi bacterium]|nr:T9SS type A sorting domain-containing protein [Chlorobiota bacterium]MCI0715882.1 T9SS type A sorting domain-containing protein [Chlorobiota bacterium]